MGGTIKYKSTRYPESTTDALRVRVPLLEVVVEGARAVVTTQMANAIPLNTVARLVTFGNPKFLIALRNRFLYTAGFFSGEISTV